jgi:hypothetical protein
MGSARLFHVTDMDYIKNSNDDEGNTCTKDLNQLQCGDDVNLAPGDIRYR